MSNIMFSRLTIVVILFFASSLTSYAQEQATIKDYVQIEGARSNYLRGIGIVSGLNGNGDSPKGPTALLMKRYLANLRGEDVSSTLSKNSALVVVTAELPPFQKKGTKISVTVTAIGDAKSLEGGTLLPTTLIGLKNRTDAGGDVVYVSASGRVVVEGDPKKGGNPTSGSVVNGGIIETELEHNILKYDEKTRTHYMELHLNKTSITMASAIADVINGSTSLNRIFVNTPVILDEPIARVLDGGSLFVRVIPRIEYEKYVGKGTYPNFIEEPARYAEIILNLPVTAAIAQEARVIINDVTKMIVVNGNVRLSPGRVQIGNVGVTIPSEMKLQDFLSSEEVKTALTPKQVVDVIKALNKGGLINAEVVTE